MSRIKAEKRVNAFTFFVPTYFSKAGDFIWTKTYETKRNGKLEIFVNSSMQYTITEN